MIDIKSVVIYDEFDSKKNWHKGSIGNIIATKVRNEGK